MNTPSIPHRAARKPWSSCPLLIVPLLLVGACANTPVTRGGTLTSYEGLTTLSGALTKSQFRVDKERVLAARTVRIMPTRFADGVGSDLAENNRTLVANRIDRSLCKGLSRRLEVVDPSQPADLTVQATITHLGKTNKIAAGASVVGGVMSVIPIPLVSPRVPVGLGSLGLEAEALSPEGRQEAAFLWSRKAQALSVMSNPTVSNVSDAYQLASGFGGSFGKLLATGEPPMSKERRAKLPKREKDETCKTFGSDGGVIGMIAENFGAPPRWTDKGARKPDEEQGSSSDEANP